MNLFSANGITAGYGKKAVVNGISFALEAGELMGIVGANGCGKTTLLKALCGILPHEGSCELGCTVLERLSARNLARLVSYIPQRSGIHIDISALDVVLMGFNPHLGLLEQPSAAMRESARDALALVGLSGLEETNYLHFSEGQKQLCILARTLVAGSRLLLLDEPESALDFRFRHQALSLLRHWAATEQGSAIVALHDPALALNYCDRLLVLDKGRVLGEIRPKTDPLSQTEQLLSQIYGPLQLQWCTAGKEARQIVMLKKEQS